MLWLLLLLWPIPASAHAQWFVHEPTVITAQFTLVEWLIAIVTLLIGLGIWGYLTRFDAELWKYIQLPPRIMRRMRLLALGIAFLFSVLAYHEELVLVYLGLIGYTLFHRRNPNLALTTLAMGIGLAFTEAALAEKLLYPEYSATFLMTHHWNFLHNFGVTWFSDRWFILQAGVVEAGLGLALTLGLAPRLTIILLLIVCILTIYLLGVTELIGHAPILIALLLYLVDSTKYSSWSILNFSKRTEPTQM